MLRDWDEFDQNYTKTDESIEGISSVNQEDADVDTNSNPSTEQTNQISEQK